MTKPRRRQAGEGTISKYQTKAGPRFLIKYGVTRDDGSRHYILKRGYLTRPAAAKALREALAQLDAGTHVAPNRITVQQHLGEWLDGLRKSPSTVASYRKNMRLHVVPHIGALRLDQVTGTRLTALYRQLEREGRVDGAGGLSARTVRYVHTILHSALGAAVRDGRLAVNPADKATPPTAREAASPEMSTWSSEQLQAFLGWSASTDDELYPAWLLLAITGVRRGELLGLRWIDVDFDAETVAIRRSATLIKNAGEGERIEIGPPKSGRSRVVDVDQQTVAVLRSHRAARATLSLNFGRADAYLFGDLAGAVRHPERFSRTFQSRVRCARRALGDDALPALRLHDIRHTAATLMLRNGEHPKVVSERLGHAKVSITLDVYSHAVPTLQREAADRLAALVFGGATP